MFTEEHYNTATDQREAKEEKDYKPSEKFIIGCRAVAGVPVDEIIKDSGMSQSYIYEQKKKVMEYAASLDEPKEDVKTIKVTKLFIIRVVLILALYCRSSLEGIQQFFEQALGVPMSIAKASRILSEASGRAQVFDDGIRLEDIHQGALDEIFQNGTPILTGVDPFSLYTFLMEEGKDRSAEMWELCLDCMKDRGLELDRSINDGAAALIAGVLRVFPDADIQRDIFHALFEMGKKVSQLERKAYSLIKDEYDLKSRAEGKRPQQKTIEMYNEVVPKTKEAIELYDIIDILYTWFKELLDFSGYDLEDSTNLIEFVLKEIEKVATDFPGLQKECEKVRKCLPSLLSYIKRLEQEMEQSAAKSGIPLKAFHLMYKQMSFGIETQQYTDMEIELAMILMHKYDDARKEFQKLLNGIKRASSCVENLNGRIRDYIDIKRNIPT